MRSFVLSTILGLGALGLSLGSPSQVRADSYTGPAFNSTTVPVARYWGGRGYYPRYGGYGYYNRGFYPYGGYGMYGGRSYYPRAYGGYYPYGGYGGYYRPYSSFYYRPGFYW